MIVEIKGRDECTLQPRPDRQNFRFGNFMSAYAVAIGGKADMPFALLTSAYDPKRTSPAKQSFQWSINGRLSPALKSGAPGPPHWRRLAFQPQERSSRRA